MNLATIVGKKISTRHTVTCNMGTIKVSLSPGTKGKILAELAPEFFLLGFGETLNITAEDNQNILNINTLMSVFHQDNFDLHEETTIMAFPNLGEYHGFSMSTKVTENLTEKRAIKV
jgi:hypothetical protein